MAFEPTKHVNGRTWPPCVSCNPNGRPVGSRTAFSHGFLKDLAEVWREHGRDTMLHTAKTNRPRSSKLRTNARFICCVVYCGKLHVGLAP